MRGDARPVQAEQHCLGEDPSDRHVHDVRRAPDEVTEHENILDGGGGFDERTGELPGRSLLLLQPSRLAERSCRRAETDYPYQVLEAAPSGPFLRATDDERLEAQAPAHDERPDAGRATEFVSADGYEIGTQRVELDGDVTHCRGGVDVHRHRKRV